VSFAQAVRECGCSEARTTMRYVFWVCRNFMRVRVMGMRTAMEIVKERVREIMRRRRIRALRC
jgi:hypothetical protein